ncbi:hypothetical protein [Piscirickettsia salmonis]|nr:hypothetical protein [Piscirickettsia salmonis]
MKIGPYIGHTPNNCILRIPIDLRKFCQKKDMKYQQAIGNYFTDAVRKRRYLGRYFAHPMMQNRRAKRDDYKSSAVRVTQRYVP